MSSNADALDKFKRRLIRSVARLLVKENKSEDEVFEQMKKETGCNCKKLWDRMRALTMKKLQRLLSADDRSENIPAVGRMTLTDWLLFDLVMVHEDIDIIGKDAMLATKKDSKPLLELFVLVQRFNIEVRNADSLAEAWTAATILYNSNGHQCSPMLMQLRWYQLKKFTRELFYNYWFTYRGSSTHLLEANKNQPTKLQRAIAQRNDQKGLENTTDVVIVEPEVETIELDDESDNERQEKCETNVKSAGSDEQQNVLNSIIKVEKEDQNPEEYSFTIEDKIQEREREVLASIDNAELALDGENLDCVVDQNLNIEPNINTENFSFVTENTKEISENNEVNSEQYEINDDNITDLTNEENNTTLPQITNVIGNVDMSEIPQALSSSDTEVESCVKDNIKIETIELEDDIIKPTINTDIEDNMDSYMIKKVTEHLKNAKSMYNKKTKPVLNIQCKKAIEKALDDLKVSLDSNTEVSKLDEEIAKKANEYLNKKTNEDIQHIESDDLEIEIAEKADLFIKSCKEKKEDDDVVMTDFDFADDGIEFIDDGIEFDDHERAATTESTGFPAPIVKSEESNVSENSDNESDGDTGKFDLKLLMDPVVYTLKLDDMEVLKNKCIQFVKSDDLIKEIDVASKVPSAISSIIEIKEENVVEDDKEIYDDIFRHDFDENLEEPVISEEKKVKLTSYLLNKPRVRDYNFIKLCKNPDFNTRLKRLNVGFFSSWRNRALLKECKPLTVDLSKAFEQKLIDGILYLKISKTTQQDTLSISSDYESADTNISRSSITMHSLFDGLVTNMLSTEHSHKEHNQLTERKTVINLPNINEVRRINQKLLTAEVSPIQLSNTVDEVLNTDSQIARKLPTRSNETQNHVKSQDSIKSSNTVVTPIIETNKNISDKQNDSVVPDTNTCPLDSQATNVCVKQKRPRKQPVVSWLTRHTEMLHVKDDVLLTIDSLSKMIQVMEGITPHPPKSKNVTKKPGRPFRGPRAQTKKSNTDSKKETNEETNTECGPQCVINIQSSGNPTKSRKSRSRRLNNKKLSRPKKSNLILVDKKDSSEQSAADITFLNDHDVASNETNMLHIDGEDSSSLNKYISTPLPPGVQLVLPPNGELTYFIQPGVTLDEIQLAQLHTVIDAVKLKLPSKIAPISAQPICVSNEVVDLTAEEVPVIETEKISRASDIDKNKKFEDTITENTSTVTDLDVVANVSVDNEENTELLFITNESSERFDINTPNVTNTTDDDSNTETENCNKNLSVTCQSEQNSISELSTGDKPTLPVQSNTNYASSHNLLDSQINTTENDDPNNSSNQAEDTDSNNFGKVSDENLSTINRKSILSDLMEISGIGIEDIAPASVPEIPPTLFPMEYSKPVINLNSGNVSIAPITSFKELKYAYENSATFFELNCITGIIQKVNVCLTKNKPVQNTLPPVEPAIKTPTPLKPIPKLVKIAPIKRKNIANSRLKPIIIRKVEKFKSLNFKTLNKMKASLLKPNLTNVRKALLRSKVKLYEKHKPPITLDITNDDSDSSDDEPLIKKARRMKEIRGSDVGPSQTEQVNELIDTNNQEIDSQMEVEYLEDEPLSSNDIENGNINDDVGPNQEANDIAPDDDQLLIENESPLENVEDLMAIEELEEDASGEECILGV
ncbi:hypothetical protein K1T71_013007 [Dendrolimus kikuchii]|uniref:Uncharacterized protein n=1 Tax=Dendrolimus kikuchii TaxID=765133 RepID=A0ACC1CJ19_9NEOP|nr:hypothetical protein K1T71_013007 [Dendrolimus kikuchii]